MPRSRRVRPITVVSIAGSDSGGGAGIQADIATFAAHAVYGATVVVAGTAQNTLDVAAIEPFSARFVSRQIDAVFSDLAPAAVKIGMLWDARTVRAVAAGLRRHRAKNVVLDPVLASTSGAPLLSAGGVRALRRDLLPVSDLVTPNRDEAAAISGMAIRTEEDVRAPAHRDGRDARVGLHPLFRDRGEPRARRSARGRRFPGDPLRGANDRPQGLSGEWSGSSEPSSRRSHSQKSNR